MLLSEKAYARLKFFALILLPALSALYFGVAQIWHLPKAEEVVGTVAVIDTFLGVLVRYASETWKRSDVKYDGVFGIENTDDGSQLRLKSIDHSSLDPETGKDELLFRVDK